jgi:hypothetical protein
MENKWSHIVNATPEMEESLGKGCASETGLLNIDVEIILNLFGEDATGMPHLFGQPYTTYIRNLNI